MDEPSADPGVLRQHLIDEAAKFLSNPKLTKHKDELKTAFLLKKGLTEAEVQAAFQQANSNLPTSTNNAVVQRPHPGGMVVPYPLSQPPSLWLRVRDVCTAILLLYGVSYGAVYVVKQWLGPWLTGRSREPTVEERLVELQQSVLGVLREVQSSLATLTTTMQGLKTEEGLGNSHVNRQLDQVKTEVTSLKALLINRRSFPAPPPSLPPSIPVWQQRGGGSRETGSTTGNPTLPAAAQEEVKEESSVAEASPQQNCTQDRGGLELEAAGAVEQESEEEEEVEAEKEKAQVREENMLSSQESFDYMSQ